MRVYVDSSALLKRVIAESESRALRSAVARHIRDGDVLVCSSLGWVEVSRALRSALGANVDAMVDRHCDAALSGIHERPITAEVVALARRLPPRLLRSLDAIHLASAVLTDVDLILAYDHRLIEAAGEHGLQTASPGA